MILINFGQNITSDKMYLKLQAKFLHSVFFNWSFKTNDSE